MEVSMEIVRKTIEKDEEYLRQISKDVNLNNQVYLNEIKLFKEYNFK